jgi:DNA-binding MarR family transcriptional regulator
MSTTAEHKHSHLNRPVEVDHAERLRAVIGKLSRRLRPTEAGAGLTPSQISVLFSVVRLGPLGLTQLAKLEGLNPTMLSRIVGSLCEEELLRRIVNPDDGRAALVQSTPAGRRLRERIHRERARLLEAHVQELSEDEQQSLLRALPALEELADSLAVQQ